MLCLNNHHSIASMCRSIRIYAISSSSSSSSCMIITRQWNATQCYEQTIVYEHRWQNLIITFSNICLHYKSQKLTDFITNDDHLFTLDLDILSFSGHKIRRSKSDHLSESNQGGVELCSWLYAGKFPWFNQSHLVCVCVHDRISLYLASGKAKFFNLNNAWVHGWNANIMEWVYFMPSTM